MKKIKIKDILSQKQIKLHCIPKNDSYEIEVSFKLNVEEYHKFHEWLNKKGTD